MDRVFYCWPAGIPIHGWAVESSPLPETEDNLFTPCPDHDGLPNSEGRDHVGLQYQTPLPR